VEEDRQKSPRNAVEIAPMLLQRGAEVDAVADIYGKSTTLELVATRIHPKKSGVQIALLDLLLGAHWIALGSCWQTTEDEEAASGTRRGPNQKRLRRNRFGSGSVVCRQR
jgi:hypothetical protein